MNKKLFILIALMLAVGMVLAACGGTEGENGTNDAGTAEGNNGGENAAEGEGNAGEAADYPNRDIEIYVGHGAGGGTDTFARKMAELMEPILGVNINVVNKEGAGGVIAKEAAANQPADGYTLVAISSFPVSTALGTNPAGLDVLTPIARVQADTYTIMTKPDQFASLEDFLAFAEENPGEIRIGGVSTGSMDEINTARFIDATGLDMTYVPFDGTGDATAALLGGHIDAMLEEIGPMIDYVESGEIEPILVFAEERLDDFPDVPTTVENGWELTQGVERGMAVHVDVPDAIKEKLEAAMKEAYDSEEYKEYEKQAYLHLREGWLGSEEYRAKLEEDIELYREAAEKIGATQ